MAVSIDYPSGVITIPQSYLSALGGSTYELDVAQLHLDLRALEDDEDGIVWPATHTHNQDIELSGVTYASIIEFNNNYTIDFEDGTYQVNCINANHNIGDVKVVDNVSLLIGNSAGLIQVTSGSGVLASDITDIADAVWDEAISGHTTAGTFGEMVAKKLLRLTTWIGLK